MRNRLLLAQPPQDFLGYHSAKADRVRWRMTEPSKRLPVGMAKENEEDAIRMIHPGSPVRDCPLRRARTGHPVILQPTRDKY